MMSFNPNEHMMKLKGKDYLQVMWRLVWVRDEHPEYGIETVLLEHEGDSAVFRASITDGEGRLLSTGHGSESKKDFGDYLEKAETKAVGRALAMLGYGTQFAADELDEGSRIVDSPVNRKPNKPDAPECLCEECFAPLKPYTAKNGKYFSVADAAMESTKRVGRILCLDCLREELDAKRSEET